MKIRQPVVAGQFYPEKKEELEKMIKSCFKHEYGPNNKVKNQEKKIFGVICPHAGYMYSGPTACYSYQAIAHLNPELAIIVGPNHFGIGQNAATMNDVWWQTPLGLVEVNSDAANKIAQISDTIKIDNYSHSQDHSLEVQIPMLQTVFSNNFQILPIILLSQDLNTARDVGKAISDIAKKTDSIIIGSSDFTHYEENSFAHLQDKALIEPILKMDVEEFYQVLKEKQVTACGFGAIASTIIACKNLGAAKGELLSYATSGDISGNNDSVVGYSAIQFI